LRLLVAAALTAAVAAGFVARQGEDAADGAAFCDELAAAADIEQVLSTLDPAALRDVSTLLADLRERAPVGLAADLDVLARFTGDLAEVVAANPGREEQATEDLARDADLARLADAGQSVERYAGATCDVALATTVETTAPPPPPTRPEAD
jgi:hypothetical protein